MRLKTALSWAFPKFSRLAKLEGNLPRAGLCRAAFNAHQGLGVSCQGPQVKSKELEKLKKDWLCKYLWLVYAKRVEGTLGWVTGTLWVRTTFKVVKIFKSVPWSFFSWRTINISEIILFYILYTISCHSILEVLTNYLSINLLNILLKLSSICQ